MARESCNLDKDEAETLKHSSSSSPTTPPSSSPSPQSLFLKPCEEPPTTRLGTLAAETPIVPSSAPKLDDEVKPDEESKPPVRYSKRCSTCRKKVGLTGFRCRCGDLFCGRHRYSDTHDCSFDYKAFGREQIAKANPVLLLRFSVISRGKFLSNVRLVDNWTWQREGTATLRTGFPQALGHSPRRSGEARRGPSTSLNFQAARFKEAPLGRSPEPKRWALRASAWVKPSDRTRILGLVRSPVRLASLGRPPGERLTPQAKLTDRKGTLNKMLSTPNEPILRSLFIINSKHEV
ncbi:hypothetical protein C4D60_Mb03t20330 [Musa balbisiana]|uniref:AN1-type domain-containing protein n=1 Tax=Musa balbisiana TaxID=52838 RepID=A0A4S8JBL5_MUSBA|nr:hypothetical protein C4D60_Mb03t20330 [Musa balbisiana]